MSLHVVLDDIGNTEGHHYDYIDALVSIQAISYLPLPLWWNISIHIIAVVSHVYPFVESDSYPINLILFLTIIPKVLSIIPLHNRLSSSPIQSLNSYAFHAEQPCQGH